ncbi:non-specific lipid-transfer protein-like protein At2g13820 [Vigna radiata var. radiata]|uniref:Non-specific lipid-transfer protein-like protein At2g13820 n=1 Tax=Vigna radiata var. radiata TaxID=3916 RepID=A0A1S3W026_VIGRR|nr:non-specific lipid-transfer protein-like protein At2g13820 [Vigna radiata var. radiata]
MAQGRMKMGVVLVMMSMMCAGAAALSPTCASVLLSLSPCLNYIDGNSSTPSSSCCLQFANVVSSQPRCLCEVFNGGAASLGVPINQTKALTLPTACNVHTPPVSRCNAASPAESPNSTPSGAGTTTMPPAKVPPSDNDNGSSGANSVKFSLPLLFLVLASTCVPTFVTLIR